MAHSITRDFEGRFRTRDDWMEEAINILLDDQAWRGISDAEFESILDSRDGWDEYGDDVDHFLEAWDLWMKKNQTVPLECPDCRAPFKNGPFFHMCARSGRAIALRSALTVLKEEA